MIIELDFNEKAEGNVEEIVSHDSLRRLDFRIRPEFSRLGDEIYIIQRDIC